MSLQLGMTITNYIETLQVKIVEGRGQIILLNNPKYFCRHMPKACISGKKLPIDISKCSWSVDKSCLNRKEKILNLNN